MAPTRSLDAHLAIDVIAPPPDVAGTVAVAGLAPVVAVAAVGVVAAPVAAVDVAAADAEVEAEPTAVAIFLVVLAVIVIPIGLLVVFVPVVVASVVSAKAVSCIAVVVMTHRVMSDRTLGLPHVRPVVMPHRAMRDALGVAGRPNLAFRGWAAHLDLADVPLDGFGSGVATDGGLMDLGGLGSLPVGLGLMGLGLMGLGLFVVLLVMGVPRTVGPGQRVSGDPRKHHQAEHQNRRQRPPAPQRRTTGTTR